MAIYIIILYLSLISILIAVAAVRFEGGDSVVASFCNRESPAQLDSRIETELAEAVPIG